MRKQLALGSLIAAAFLLSSPARSATYNFLFAADIGNSYPVATMTGQLTTDDTPVSPGVYFITALTGTINSGPWCLLSCALELVPTVNPPGTTTHSAELDRFYDNLLIYPPPSAGAYFTADGLAFRTTSLESFFRIYALPISTVVEDPMDFKIFDLDLIRTDEIFARIDPTPIPGALPLFAGGLGALGWLGLRRRKKASA
jgi:hypothetical protein